MKHIKKYLSAALLSVCCMVLCIGLASCDKESHTHTYTETADAAYLKSAATCTEKAVYYKSCSCGEKSTDTFEYGEPKGHDYSTLKQSATHHWYECTCGAKDGETAHTPSAAATETTDQVCTVCKYVITPATGHIHSSHLTKTETKSATCTQTGNTEYYVCSCGKWFTDSTATTEITDKDSVTLTKTQHSFTQQVADDKYIASSATCTAKATYYHSCVCGEKGTDTFEYGEPNGHDYGEWVSNNDGTHVKTCKNDASHAVTENCHGGTATCTEKATCADCGGKYGELKEHDYSTLKQSATHHWYECACGAKNGETAHTPSAAATETTDQVCTVCGYVITPATGHIHTNHLTKTEAKSATCTQTGNTEYYVCSCGKWFTDSTATTEITDKDSVIVAKTQHDYATLKQSATHHWYECACGAKNGEVEHTPSAAATETTDQVCTVCGYVITPATGHIHSSHLTKTEAKSATCTQTGNTEYYVCSCGKWFTDSTATTEITDKDSVIVAKTQHSFTRQVADDKYIASSATCTAKATYYYSCVCGEKGNTTFEYGEPKGHDYGEWINAIDATCESDGTKGHYTCSACGKYFDQNKAELSDLTVKGGHVYGEWVSNNDGTHVKTCKNDVSHVLTENCRGGEATCTEKATCSVCGGKYGDFKEHEYSSSYVYDKTHHWQPATCGCDLKQNYGTHTVDDSGWCTVCDASVTSTVGLSYKISSDEKYYEVSGYNGTSTKVRIPDSYQGLPVTGIRSYAFNACLDITAVIIPDSVTTIGNYAFWACNALTTVDMGNCVTSIGNYAFQHCCSLTKIVVPDSVTSIGEGVFNGCGALVEITIPFVGATAGKTSADDNQFPLGYIFGTTTYTGAVLVKQSFIGVVSPRTSATKSYYFPASLRKVTVTGGAILNGAFYDCNMLTSITIGKNVTGIESAAFHGCGALEELTIPFAGIRAKKTSDYDWSKYLFGNMFGITDYVGGVEIKQTYKSGVSTYTTTFYVPSSLKTVTVLGGDILYGAFYGCNMLTSITIGEDVTNIGEYAFYGCDALTKINYCATACADLSADNYAFYAKNGKSRNVTVGANVQRVPAYLFNPHAGSNISRINKVVFADGSVCLSIGTYAFAYCSISTIKLPDSLTTVAASAFHNCWEMKTVTVGSGLTSVGEKAFYLCSGLKQVIYTGSVEQWASVEFANEYSNPLSYAKKLYLGDLLATEINIANLTTVKAYAFYNCDSLTSAILGEKLTTVGNYAFYGCVNLSNVVMGDKVTNVGDYAFYGCGSLTSVYYCGDAAGWAKVTIGGNNTCLTDATVYYYRDTKPTVNFEGTAYLGNYWRYVDGKPEAWVYIPA